MSLPDTDDFPTSCNGIFKRLSGVRSHAVWTLTATLLLLVSCQTTEPVTDEEAGAAIEEYETDPDGPLREQRAAWIATVANIDWPSEPGLSVEEQKEELQNQLDRVAAMNMNSVIFQVRPAANSMYDSPYEPWAPYLTGQMGRAPEPWYDPLEFAVEEAHKRGLELHAWFNPYRAGRPGYEPGDYPENHIKNRHPEWVVEYGNYLWIDPGHPEASAHSMRVMMDVVERYDVDGIHLDDYFYPYPSYDDGADFPDSLSWNMALEDGVEMSREDWRRANVDNFMQEIYETLKEIAPHVKFGISPIGVWRPDNPEGAIFGFDAYEALYADARKWIREGWVDNFTPQLYHLIDTPGRSFPAMMNWWEEQNLEGRHIWAGLYTSRVRLSDPWPYEEITGQTYIAQAHPGVSGTVHFSMRALMEKEGLVDHIMRDTYREPTLIPAAPWLGDTPPARPDVELFSLSDRLELSLRAGNDRRDVRWWVIRSDMGEYWETEVAPGQMSRITYHGNRASVWPEQIEVSAVDRLGNRSEAVLLRPERPGEAAGGSIPKPGMVARADWGPQPGGREANAVRRNLAEGDTLRFRNLTVVVEEMIKGRESSGENEEKSGDNDSSRSHEAESDSVRISLYRYGVHESRTVAEQGAFNWYGYHIGALAVNTRPDQLAGGLTELEISTVASISRPPAARAARRETGGAGDRLRVPHEIVNITLHHTGSREPLTADEDPVERLTGLYEWGAESRNWWDVPYHYLIGLDGTIYEGRDHRYVGDTNTTYDPSGHLLISVIGNYNLQEPNEEQLDAIARLMAWAADRYDVPTERIYGHYDWAESGCPGDHLRPFLEQGVLQKNVNRLLEQARAGE